MTSDEEQIWAAVRDMYDGYLAADTARIDRHILPEATIWDSERPGLAHGLAALDVIRAQRPPRDQGPRVAAIDVYRPVLDVIGDVAVARHVFAVRYAGDARPAGVVRNTGVWQRTGGGWRLAHNHEDALPAATAAAYLDILVAENLKTTK
ncbi:nuclear transport factor 2 family protein [Phytohabitans kaempferiae]|uniref:Nuclear transport factor 2 family protein n=1 Tax=Phytohabitans kaempferiae TaxID=1620943 RepID=A0ABV6MAM1_9ACTN